MPPPEIEMMPSWQKRSFEEDGTAAGAAADGDVARARPRMDAGASRDRLSELRKRHDIADIGTLRTLCEHVACESWSRLRRLAEALERHYCSDPGRTAASVRMRDRVSGALNRHDRKELCKLFAEILFDSEGGPAAESGLTTAAASSFDSPPDGWTEHLEYPSWMLDPVTMQLLEDPVVLTTGRVFSRETWEAMQKNEATAGKDPVSRQPAALVEMDSAIPRNLIDAIEDWNAERGVPFSGKKLKMGRGLAIQAIRERRLLLRNAIPELKADREAVLAAVEHGNGGREFQHASADLRGDREFVLTVVRMEGEALEHAADELKRDREVVLEAVRNDPEALMFADAALKRDKDLVLEAVRRLGFTLHMAADELRRDPEVVTAAVRENERALQFAAEELQADPEIQRVAEETKAEREEQARRGLEEWRRRHGEHE